MQIYLSSLLVFLFLVGCPSKAPKPEAPDYDLAALTAPDLELPAVGADENLHVRAGYRMVYLSKYKLPKWAAYRLTRNQALTGDEPRKSFQKDKAIMSSPVASAYAKSGYDRGHLVPAEDMAWSAESSQASFLMTNMTPQSPDLNQHFLRGLEAQIREWAKASGEVFVVTGPIVKSGLKTISKSGVAIPEKHYKVVYQVSGGRPKAIAFLLPQDGVRGKDPCLFAVTVDEVEAAASIDLFPRLPDSVEKEVEATVDCKSWLWGKAPVSTFHNSRSDPLASIGSCPVGTILKSASIQGCCSGHGGVAGPKKYRACCGSDDRVVCNDATKSANCMCTQ